MLDSYRQRLQTEGTLTLTIRARPNARRTKIVGVMEDGSLKIDLHAAPEDGEANEELLKCLAAEFSVSRQAVTLLSGQRGRMKMVTIVL